MVSLKIEVRKKDVTWVVLLVAVLGFGFVLAVVPWNSAEHPMWHSANDVKVNVNGIDTDLQSVIDNIPTCNDENQALGWDGSTFICRAISSGSEFDLVYGLHSSTQCTNLGGTVADDGSDKLCHFNQASCPTGWTQFKDWSTTANSVGICEHYYVKSWDSGVTNYCVRRSASDKTCNTGEHSFSNKERERCTTTQCIGCSGGRTYYHTSSAVATITQRGCY